MITKIFAHRGSSSTHPENTMAAFKEAEKVGADGIEIDVHFTKDNKLAVIHDDTVNRTTNGTGYVRGQTLKQLRQLDAGSWFSNEFNEEKIPTLQEVLEWIKYLPHLHINIELKYVALDYEGFEESVLDTIEKYKVADRVILSSYNHYALKKISELHSEIECAVLYLERLYEPWNYAKTIGSTSLHPYALVTDRSLLEEAKENGFPVRVYTVNEEEQLKNYLAAYCPAIITDVPELALRLRKEIQRE